MRATFDFGGTRESSSVTKPNRIGTVTVDKGGIPISDAKPPALSLRKTPFTIEFSQATPSDIYPSSEDFFEVGDEWERSNVFSGRSSLRNLGRCILFPVDDYYCREFTIDAGFLNGKVFLQRHPDDVISHQQEGYGAPFERSIVTPGHPEAHAFHEFVTYSIGEHALFVRCETDCLDKNQASIGVTTKKLKKNKKGGYYPPSPNYYQEQWLQMVLSGTAALIIGERDEGPRDTGSAQIIQLTTLSAAQVAEKGDISPARQREVFDGIGSILSWIKRCFAQAVATGMTPADQMAQAHIVFSNAGGVKRLTFSLLPAEPAVVSIQDQYAQAVLAL